jgi:hypothetical protein
MLVEPANDEPQEKHQEGGMLDHLQHHCRNQGKCIRDSAAESFICVHPEKNITCLLHVLSDPFRVQDIVMHWTLRAMQLELSFFVICWIC